MHVVGRIDLTSLARSLRDTGRHPALVKAIDRAAAAGSVREDLRTALHSLQQIVALQDRDRAEREDGSLNDETVATGALFIQAVILYARATETQGDRSKLLGEAKLSSADRATHDEAMVLRNKVIAHYGRGEELSDGPIVKEAVVLSLYRDGARRRKRVGVYTTRAAHKVAFAARLAALIETRLAEIADKYQKLFDESDAALETAAGADTELGRSLPDFGFDPDRFAISPKAAAHLRAQLDAEEGADLDYTVRVPRS